MAKPDGRIEKGQRIASAISARAWNRAQDAADIVLGVRPGVSVPDVVGSSDYITVRVPANYTRVSENPLQPGDGLSLPVHSFQTTLLPNATNITEASLSSTQQRVNSESDLPQYDAASPSCITLPSTQENFVGARCGVIETVSALENGFYTCRVRIRGLVRCRVLLLQTGNFVSPPPVYPTNASLQPFWRRYLMASDYGQGSILGLGAWYRMDIDGVPPSFTYFPAVAEALVLLG